MQDGVSIRRSDAAPKCCRENSAHLLREGASAHLIWRPPLRRWLSPKALQSPLIWRPPPRRPIAHRGPLGPYRSLCPINSTPQASFLIRGGTQSVTRPLHSAPTARFWMRVINGRSSPRPSTAVRCLLRRPFPPRRNGALRVNPPQFYSAPVRSLSGKMLNTQRRFRPPNLAPPPLSPLSGNG